MANTVLVFCQYVAGLYNGYADKYLSYKANIISKFPSLYMN